MKMLKLIYLAFLAISVVANEARMPSGDERANATDATPPSPSVPGHAPASRRPLPPLEQTTPPPTPTPPSSPSLLTQAKTTPIPYLACGQEEAEGGEEELEEGGEEESPAADLGKVIKCPAVHDGLACWPTTAAATYAFVPCPASFTLHPNTTKRASRYCGKGGEWEPEPVDYLPCATNDIFTKDDSGVDRKSADMQEDDASTILHSIIAARLEMCVRLMNEIPKPTDGRLFCPRLFDGWSCWNDTPAGETAYSPCPYFITGFDHKRQAHKVCNEDGTWFKHPDNNRTWSNYTTCVDLNDLMMRQLINTIYIAGYSVSLIALAISLVIFFYFRNLQCTRIRLHKNLFVSFMINNVMWIAWYLEVAGKPDTVLNNSVGCQILHILVHYFLVSSYYWMFSEGLYLHMLLMVAFVAEDRLMKWFYLLGWGAPALIILVYAAARGSAGTTDTQYCWIEESHYTFILSAPVCVSMLANLVFLVNIVRVLVTKLRANHVAADTNGTRKAVRATLILIPLLGLHYVLMPFRPAKGSHWEFVYEVISAVVSSFQGFCVALLFCFCNSEVIMAVKKKWYQYQFMHDHRRFSFTSACIMSVNETSRMTGTTTLGVGAATSGGGEDVSPGGSGGISPSTGRAAEGRGSFRTTTGDRALLLESHRAVVERSRSNSFTIVDVRQKEGEEEEEEEYLDGNDTTDLKRRRRKSYEAQRCTNPSETTGLVVEVLSPEGTGAKGKGGKGGQRDAIEMKAITPAVVLTTHVHDEDVGVMQV
ncbi:calcitonin gene-related peptide type 1 receptor-like isoform X2 [Penaeus japonicus]|uniref:calcitonin gene-related peptide type 1 receptor-like isoform X2 n=1 Tax=Penaeus japonicus TaxID=27405 RepID=UPI001C7137A2|nr:calcitonin gene-related peptide type 1 receptor-like isoform X2 [Penaeus japonicus]